MRAWLDKRLVAAVAAAGLLLAACGDDSTDTEEGTEESTSTEASEDSTGSDTEDGASGTTADDDGVSDEAQPRFVLDGETTLTTEEINSYVDFVENKAGREFTGPPRIVVQDEADYLAGFLDHNQEGFDLLEDNIDLLARFNQALGLSDMTSDELLASYSDFLTSPSGVAAYYDPDSDSIFIPSRGEVDDFERSIFVHELVHALDDQHVDLAVVLDEMQADPTQTEPTFVRGAVVEGRATSIQNQWVVETGASITPPPPSPEMLAAPPAVVNSAGYPYVFGAAMIDALGGAAETWDLFDSYPASSEQILATAPDAAAVGEMIDVETPEADGPVLAEYDFGSIGLVTWLLGDTLSPDQARVDQVLGAALGWAGGSAVLWGDDSESCLRAGLAADSETDRAEMEAAIQTWVDSGDGRSIETVDGVITVTGCAPYLS